MNHQDGNYDFVGSLIVMGFVLTAGFVSAVLARVFLGADLMIAFIGYTGILLMIINKIVST